MKDPEDIIFLVSDLHGKTRRYEKLFSLIREERPRAVFLGGDLLPHGLHRSFREDFTGDFLARNMKELKKNMGTDFPPVFLILGNDDPRSEEKVFIELEELGLWKYLHQRKAQFGEYTVYGYSHVPPTPFLYKDWERFDVSRYVDPGCVSPLDGIRTEFSEQDIEFLTIADDIRSLTAEQDLKNAIFLFHSPPYKTYLDRAALDGKKVDHVPLDVHVGSIAIKRFIEERQPYMTFHGHIHESSRLTGQWMQKLGRTMAFSAAWDGEELALVRIPLGDPVQARRELV